MTNLIFDFLSYRPYLKQRLEAEGKKSGLKRRASEALSVHTTFISQVVLGKADLSLDQGERMNAFLGHTDEESEFFLDLIIIERASEAGLKKRFEARLAKNRLDYQQIQKRLESPRELAATYQEKFYSSHLYGLLHVLASIPRYQTLEALSSITGDSKEIISEAVGFLTSIGLLATAKGRIIPGEQHIHLGRQSKNIWRHHANWRMATLQKLSFSEPSDLHYSLAFSCSRQDAAKLRESLLKQLKAMSDVIGTSPEEDAYVYCFDLFRWK